MCVFFVHTNVTIDALRIYLILLHSGPKHRLRFLCELRVNGIPYVGAGNSTNKKDAEKNAARDFVNFLVRTGEINANDVPASAIEQGGALPARDRQQPQYSARESVPMFEVCVLNWFYSLLSSAVVTFKNE